jgi:hypothetical protein
VESHFLVRPGFFQNRVHNGLLHFVAGKRRSAKAKARDKFKVIAIKIGSQALLDAINRYVLSPDVEKDDGAYTPALDRWLAQGRWEVWLEDVAVKRVGFV